MGELGERQRQPCDSATGAPLTLCVSPHKAEQLVGNESRWDAGQSRRVALALREAMREARGYFGSDVHLAYRLAGDLLRHESHQRGFHLAATQDVHFTEVGMRSQRWVHARRGNGQSRKEIGMINTPMGRDVGA